MRGAGGQGQGSHGRLEFRPESFATVGIASPSTVAAYLPPLDLSTGVRAADVLLLSQILKSDPQFSRSLIVAVDSVHNRRGLVAWENKWLGTIHGLVDIEAVLDMTEKDLVKGVAVWVATDASGLISVPVAAYLENGYTTKMMEDQYEAVSTACSGHGMNIIAVVADGLSLPGLESLHKLHPQVSPFVDYPHLLKTKLSILRLLRELSTDGRSFSLFVIIDAKEAGKGFVHLTMDEHLNPEDKMRVQPALELIGLETRHDLRVLGTTEAMDLEKYFGLLERYYHAFDIKRTSAGQPNPHKFRS